MKIGEIKATYITKVQNFKFVKSWLLGHLDVGLKLMKRMYFLRCTKPEHSLLDYSKIQNLQTQLNMLVWLVNFFVLQIVDC